MTTTIANRLCAPFRTNEIKWRIGNTNQDKTKGLALAYIDARTVMRRLDEACGAFGWASSHSVSPDGKKVTCSIAIRNPETGEWVSKSDGAGQTDYEAEKGSYSDSLKRAAIAWNVGRYLYDLSSPWVEIEPAGRSYRIKATELTRLAKMIETLTGPGKQTISDDGWDSSALRDWCRAQFQTIKTASACVDWWNSGDVAEAFERLHASQKDAEAAKKELGQHRRKILDAPRPTNGSSSRLSARA